MAAGFGYGPEVEDSISGWLFPTRLMTTPLSGTGLVSKFIKDGSLDKRKEY
jgi:hypothetical protein